LEHKNQQIPLTISHEQTIKQSFSDYRSFKMCVKISADKQKIMFNQCFPMQKGKRLENMQQVTHFVKSNDDIIGFIMQS